MKTIRFLTLTLFVFLTLAACGPFVGKVEVELGTTPTETTLPPDAGEETSSPNGEEAPTPSLSPTPESTPASTSLPLPTEPTHQPDPDDAILILEPGPGSHLISPLHIAGMADSTFEQNLVIRVVLDDGTELALTPTTIQSELGQRGPFAVDIPFTITGERQAFIQVYATSARDGGITHLSSVGVTLTETDPVDIRPVTDTSERINIYTPSLGSTVSGGVAHVEGFALASFEQHLLVEVLDVDGNLIGFSPVIVTAPDLGIPGPFVVDVPYTLGEAAPGRIVVRDPSPAFDGDVHLASIEVQLEP